MTIDTNKLTLQEKGALVEQLTREIVEEMTSEEFSSKSAKHKKMSGLVKVFGNEYFVGHASILHDYTREVKGAD